MGRGVAEGALPAEKHLRVQFCGAEQHFACPDMAIFYEPDLRCRECILVSVATLSVASTGGPMNRVLRLVVLGRSHRPWTHLHARHLSAPC